MDHNGKISCSQDQQTSCSVTKVDKEVFRERIVCQPSNTSVPQDLVGSEGGPAASDASEVPGLKLAVVAETSNGSAVIAEVEDYPINLDDYNSAADLEVLGLEKLTTELQAHGFKCGGTLQVVCCKAFSNGNHPYREAVQKSCLLTNELFFDCCSLRVSYG